MIMVNSRHSLAQKESVEIDELKNEVLFLPMRTYPVSRYLQEMFQKAEMPFPAENALSYLTAQQMAAKGIGIGFSSVHTVRMLDPELRYIPIRTPHAPWKLCLYWRKGTQWSHEAKSFVKFVKEYCRSDKNNVCVMQGQSNW